MTALPPTDGAAGSAADARLHALVAHADAGIAELDLDGAFTLVNPAVCVLTGYTEVELRQRRLVDLLHSDDLPGYGARFAAAVAHGTSVVDDLRYVRPDGSTMWGSTRISVIRDHDDQPQRVVVVVTDSTARTQAAAARAEWARLLDLSNDAIIVRDVHDRIIYWNHGATELYGWTRAEAVGQDLHTLLRTEFEAPFAQLIATLQQHDRLEGEVVQVTRDGRRINTACRWALDRDAAGNPGAILTTYNDITVRKAADAALRASEARLHKALSIDTAGVLFFTLDGRIRDTNAAFARMTGYTREELRSLADWTVLTDAADRDATARTVANLATRGESPPYEKRMVRKDGSHWWGLFAPTILSGAGRDAEGVEFIIDITERKRTDDALRTSEERLRALIANLPRGAAFVVDRDLRYVLADGEALYATGGTPDAYVGKTIFEALPAAVATTYAPLYRQALGGAPFAYEHALDGRTYVSRGVPLRGAQGEIDAVLAVSYDITTRKRAEDALRASEERLRLLLESVQDYAIFTLDPQGHVTSWNEGAHRLKGYTAEEILGHPVEQFYTPEDVAARKPAHEMATALRDGRSEDESWRVRKDGVRLWVNEVMTPLYAADGTHLGFTKVSRDLTARKQAEDNVARALVEQHVARAEAEAALAVRDQFLSIASHELRTPLTALLGYASLLPQAAARGSGKAEQMTERIVRQAQRLNGLIDQLLDVSRLQRGQFVVARRPVDLAALVSEVVDEVRVTLPAHSPHTVALTTPDDPVVVDGDAERLEQVLHNLLSNALKYSPQGGQVQVVVHRTATEAVVAVTDEGIGIPADAQERLFTPFYRAPNVGGQASGFGLGLHIVREIVERHGGRIAVESTEGQGSTVRVMLPLHDTEAVREAGA